MGDVTIPGKHTDLSNNEDHIRLDTFLAVGEEKERQNGRREYYGLR